MQSLVNNTVVKQQDNQCVPSEVLSKLNGILEEEILLVQNGRRSIPLPTEDNWKDVLSALKIDPLRQYSKPSICIAINDSQGVSRFGTLGNFSLIIGKAKSRKTYFISYLLSQALNNREESKITIKVKSTARRIAFFDTEQTEDDTSQIIDRVIKSTSKWDNDSIEFYSLRTFSPDQRKFLIEKYIYNTPDLGIVIIDGIRDLIKDINSPEEATEISSNLLKWTEETNIHIVTVLHQNKGDNNARGHVGTELVNKAETVISIEKKEEISIVKPEQCRGKDFEPFAFSVDSEGLPYILEDWSTSTTTSKQSKSNVIQQGDEWHLKLLETLFTNIKHYQYKELVEVIKIELGKAGYNNGDNASKKAIEHLLNKTLITKKKIEGNKYPVYTKS